MNIRHTIIFIAISGILTLIFVILLIYSSIANRPQTQVRSTPRPTPVGTVPLQNAFMPAEPTHPESELEFNRGSAEIEKNYPWLNKLPIKTEAYFVYFDTRKKAFMAKLYTTPDQQQLVKAEIMSSLRGLNIPVQQFKIIYDN